MEDGFTLKRVVYRPKHSLILSASVLAVLFFLGAWAQESPQTQSQQNQGQQSQAQQNQAQQNQDQNQTQPSSSQQPQLQRPNNGQQPTFTSKVRVVEIPATVRDKHKQIVRNLTKDDFTLQEDGRPQVISYFSEDTNLPLTLGLLVDTSRSQQRVLEDERHTSFVFLQQMLHDKNMAFVIHFDYQVELLQDLTNDRNKLESALDSLQIGQRSDNNNGSSGGQGSGSGGGWGGHRRGGGGGGYGGGGTQLYDAIYLASDDLMKKQQGRKAVIVLSDGVDHGSKVSLDHAIETAQRADTMVYSILFKDEDHQFGGFGGGPFGGMGRHGGGYPQEQRPDGKKILERISKETGGRLFEVSKKEPVDQIYNQIADELRYQYELGYTSDRADLTGYHKIQLTTKKKDLEVQARDGYYADNPITASSSQTVH
jgi:VWFA-related protein